MFLRLFVPMMLLCALVFADSEVPSSEETSVPRGLEISEQATASGALVFSGQIAQEISSAGLDKKWVPDFMLIHGQDLSWENWFSPAKNNAEEW